MAVDKVRIVRVDPYHKMYGLLIPQLAQRLAEGLNTLGDDSGDTLAHFMARLWGKDPTVLLIAAVDSKGSVKGYTAAMKQTDDSVMFIQPRMDEPTENDAVGEMVQTVEQWTKSLGAIILTLVSKRFDKNWIKAHGFEVTRYILTKEIK